MFDPRESDTYQTIIENREDGARDILFALGEDRFGPIDEANRLKLEAIVDMHRLRRIALHLFESSNWDEALVTPCFVRPVASGRSEA